MARKHYCPPQDGLSLKWGGRVWLNPPYSREAVKWLRKMAGHGDGVALVFARTETAWFRECVWEAADGLLFLDGRIHFYRPNGIKAAANAGAPSVLVAYGMANVRSLEKSGIKGNLVTNWRMLG